MYRSLVFVVLSLLLVGSPAPAHNIMIEAHEIPMEIDTWGRFKQNQAIFMWTPFDSMRTHWDLTQYQGGYFARVGLRVASQGRPPAPDSMPLATICEMDTLGSGSEQWTFLYKNTLGLWIDGIDFTQQSFRFIGNYRPDQQVYNTPVYRGAGWLSAVQWVWEMLPGIFVTFNQQNTKRVVAKGKVKVPMSGAYYWPCLVIRDYMEFTDNIGGTPQRRWIYEWVVPGRFLGANGVGAAMSQNGASENFINVEQFFQLEQIQIPGWDLVPPTFADPVVIGDTSDLGPFVVSTKVLDNVAVGPESLFYRVNVGAWQAVGSDSTNGNTRFYTIPAVTGEARVDYFYWAMDRFSADRNIEIWTTWPVCSPESTMITFQVTQVGVEHPSPTVGLPAVNVGPNPFKGSVRFGLSLEGTEPAELRIYTTSGRLVRSETLYPDSRGQTGFSWNGTDFRGRSLPAGTYLWQVTSNSETQSGKVVFDR